MTCECTGCDYQAIAKVTWIGQVRWTGHFCQAHLDELWRDHGLVTMGKADVILERIA